MRWPCISIEDSCFETFKTYMILWMSDCLNLACKFPSLCWTLISGHDYWFIKFSSNHLKFPHLRPIFKTFFILKKLESYFFHDSESTVLHSICFLAVHMVLSYTTCLLCYKASLSSQSQTPFFDRQCQIQLTVKYGHYPTLLCDLATGLGCYLMPDTSSYPLELGLIPLVAFRRQASGMDFFIF